MTVKQLLGAAAAKLRDAGVEGPRSEAEILLAHALGVDRSWLYAHDDAEVDADVAPLVARRCKREPLAYIVGERGFFGLTFAVTPSVLVPRPETELLVELALERLVGVPSPLVVDAGVGSGAILLSLLRRLPTARGIGVDISPAALEVARSNAAALAVDDRAEFVNGDLLSTLARRCDAIVSNPPYVRRDELPTLSPEVRHEPTVALDGGCDGLDCYRRLLPQARRLLAANALLPDGAGRSFCAVEIGATQAAAVSEIARRCGFARADVHRDLAGLDRVVVMSC